MQLVMFASVKVGCELLCPTGAECLSYLLRNMALRGPRHSVPKGFRPR